jgi:hypothetical protein
VDASDLPRAVAAAMTVATACGLRVDDAVVLHDSNRLAVHLRPCDALVRVAPVTRRYGADFEVEVAQRLASTAAPDEVVARYAGADGSLVRDCWPELMLAMVTAWRCEPGDDLPNGSAMARQWLATLRAELGA